MQISCKLCLPRDEASVPIVRHICRDALLKLGVVEDCVSDIEIAVTEACANVLHHAAGAKDEYEVSVEISDDQCDIRVIDTGAGFDHASAGLSVSADSAESGRGVFLMRAFVDDLQFISEPEQGTVVHLVKKLTLKEDAPMKILTGEISVDGASASN